VTELAHHGSKIEEAVRAYLGTDTDTLHASGPSATVKTLCGFCERAISAPRRSPSFGRARTLPDLKETRPHSRGSLHLKRSRPDPLSPREREVLQLVVEGKTTKEIARLRGVSVKTTENHRTRIMAKLDIHDTAGLVRYAIRRGLIRP